MRKFKDCNGREWELALTLGKVRNIKNKLGIDLLNADQDFRKNPACPDLYANEKHPVALVSALYADLDLFVTLLHAAADPADALSRDEFESLLDGDTFSAAHNAFFEELHVFFTGVGKEVLAQALLKLRQIVSKAAEKATAKLDQGMSETTIDEMLDREINSLFGEQLGDGQAQSDSPASST